MLGGPASLLLYLVLPPVAPTTPLAFPSCFCTVLFAHRPFQSTSLGNAFIAGDWVKGVKQGANGEYRVQVAALSMDELRVYGLWRFHSKSFRPEKLTQASFRFG